MCCTFPIFKRIGTQLYKVVEYTYLSNNSWGLGGCGFKKLLAVAAAVFVLGVVSAYALFTYLDPTGNYTLLGLIPVPYCTPSPPPPSRNLPPIYHLYDHDFATFVSAVRIFNEGRSFELVPVGSVGGVTSGSTVTLDGVLIDEVLTTSSCLSVAVPLLVTTQYTFALVPNPTSPLNMRALDGSTASVTGTVIVSSTPLYDGYQYNAPVNAQGILVQIQVQSIAVLYTLPS